MSAAEDERARLLAERQAFGVAYVMVTHRADEGAQR